MSGWSVVIPARGGSGKSRLVVPGVDRAALARAIALDTIAAVHGCPAARRVVVVTSDAAVADALPPGCEHLDDPGSGLNDAVRAGLAVLSGDPLRAALLGDLPALHPGDLAAVLAAARDAPAGALPDAEGTGTTLLTWSGPSGLAPQFGEGSFARHLASGFADLSASAAAPVADSVRRDVDTAAQLRAAVERGVGALTREVLAAALQR